MSPEQWARAKELFLEALERPPAERLGWVDARHGDEEPIVTEVRRLIAAHEEAGSFIEQPAIDIRTRQPSYGTPGLVLGHYRLEQLVGVGGMGEVYRATDLELGRSVAIKLVREDDAAGRQRLLREARHASRLNHPNICTIHDVGRHEHRPYIVMEFVEGRPLGELIPAGGLTATTALRYAVQMADAVAHAHAEGVVHRDLKSANVMVTPAASVRLLDFGLAKHLRGAGADSGDSSVPTRTSGMVAGTLSYMAPEVLCGEPANARSDLWAFGVLLHEMVTGRLPFSGKTPFEISGSILHEAPPPMPPDVPPKARAIIFRCLRKSPEERYPNAGELRRALDAALVEAERRASGGRLARGTATLTRLGTFVTARRKMALVAGLLLLVSLIGAWAWSRTSFRADVLRASGLAVLPFQNLSGDAAQDYFADGLTEALIVDLGRTSGLRVISRTTAMRYRGTTKTLPEVAKELGVEALLEGSVARASGRVRVTAKLFRAEDQQIWTESYERTLGEVLVLQRDIVRAVTTHVRSALALPDEVRLSMVRSVDPEVYEAYLKGRYYWNRRTPDSLRQAVEQYEFATRKDPTYAPAHVGLADCFNQLGTVLVGVAPAAQMRPRAKAAALAALQIDDGLGEAHAALGYVHHYDWEWAAAGREFDRAIALAPNYGLAHIWRANYLVSLRRFDDALKSVRKALDLDPMSPVVNTNVGWTLHYAGRQGEAVDAYLAALALDPNYVQAHMRLGSAYVDLGRFEEAAREAQTVVALSGETPATLLHLAAIHAESGRVADAENVLQRALAMRGRHYVSPWSLAAIQFKLGRLDEGLAFLDQAYQERSNGIAYTAVEHYSLHNDPRYRRILRLVGLEAVATASPAAASTATVR